MRTLLVPSLALVLLLLASCGGSSGSAAPGATAVILFPTAVSSSERTTVRVRGTASNAVAVQVNGVAATSSDGFATW